MKNITVQDIVQATGGRLLCGSPDLPIRNISIDSRTMKGDDIFVPIIGAKVDAHRFIGGAFQAGAAATFTSEHDEMEDTHPWIRVEDTVKALQDLGAFCRNRLTMPIIGVTGSVGKTSTREMVACALSAEKKVYSTTGNSNGQLGVPITLSEADPDADVIVLEMGMSEPGEMSRISAVARVSMGVVTNIGVSHIENLGSRENIRKEKMHMADYLSPDQVMVLNGEDDQLEVYRKGAPFRVVYYGLSENNDYWAENIRVADGRTYFTVHAGEETFEMQLPQLGQHHVMNALAALAVAAENKVSPVKAAKALESWHGFARRLEINEKNGCTIIDDSYNASPDSMRAALQVLSVTETAGRRIAVLADMLELGPDSPKYHSEVGAYAASCGIDRIFTIGTLARYLAEAAKAQGVEVSCYDSNAEALEDILAFRKPGDTILLKGSNSMKLSEIVKEL